MTIFNTAQSIGEIVSILPAAGEVFKAYGIDFCCGGGRPLETAIKEQRLNGKEILGKLDKAYEEAERIRNKVDFRAMGSRDLVDYIVNTHHVYMRKTLPLLGELTAKVLRAHGTGHRELFKVHRLFNNLRTELEQHLIKEEELLFPLIKGYEADKTHGMLQEINNELNETEDEHEAAGDILKELRKITGNYEIPADGCSTFETAYRLLQEMEADLFQHIHLENNILFRRYAPGVYIPNAG